jgi:hypothetical protein
MVSVLTALFWGIFIALMARERRARTMDDISIKELGPGVILEVTKPDGERYRYSIPTWPPGDGGPGYRKHELEINVFYGGGGGDVCP